MGATGFEQYGVGKTVDDAFRAAVKEAQYWHGHGGYSGTIAEKDSYFVLPERARVDPQHIVDLTYKSMWDDGPDATSAYQRLVNIYDARLVRTFVDHARDKWSDAVAIPVPVKFDGDLIPKTPTGKRRAHMRAWLFFGSASC